MKQKIQEVLAQIINPITHAPILESSEINSISEGDGFVKLQLQFDSITVEEKRVVRQIIEKSFQESGIEILVNIVSKNQASQLPKEKSASIQEFIPSSVFHNFKKIIAVYSTKGGVGKSTISVNLALELSQKNLKVALVDLDLYGPSVPRIFGFRDKVSVFKDKFIPAEIHGIHMMSVGLLIPDLDSPLIWRAPIANGVLKQIFVDTMWDSDYDVLVIDMPPGTGDIPIAVAQNIPVNGVLCVSTPQGVALEDTVKGISMLNKFETEIYGIVFNMGSVICPDCQKSISLFPKNQELTNLLSDYEIEIVAELPLDTNVAYNADQGLLDELSEDSLWKKEFSKITDALYIKISK